ncbi:MAG: GNAT family N-acetyltransferase [Oscillospiraceae bacterium]|nr:GNAT family N-acetyltransferase [Oscillospiraceae bacterium]
MFELSKDSYGILLKPVLQTPFNMLMARSVIERHADGRIFVDSCESPQSFYIVHSYGMTFLCGDCSNDMFNKGLFDYFNGISWNRKNDEWLQAFHRDWDAVMGCLVDEHKAISYSRLNFKFSSAEFNEKYNQVDKSQYEIISIPMDMLFKISGSVVPKDYWRTPKQFSEIAKAFTVIIDGKPVSTAFTSARHDDKLEIGIETIKEYHGKGLGYLACAKLIEYCIENNLEPVWSCRLENTASANLAKKLGFNEVARFPYYHIPK